MEELQDPDNEGTQVLNTLNAWLQAKEFQKVAEFMAANRSKYQYHFDMQRIDGRPSLPLGLNPGMVNAPPGRGAVPFMTMQNVNNRAMMVSSPPAVVPTGISTNQVFGIQVQPTNPIYNNTPNRQFSPGALTNPVVGIPMNNAPYGQGHLSNPAYAISPNQGYNQFYGK